MNRVVLAGILGGLAAFVWGNVVWMVLPVYDTALRTLPAEESVAEALKATGAETGVYILPGFPADTGDKAAMDVFTRKHEAGPLAYIMYTSQGKPMMPPSTMIRGLLFNLAAAFVAAMLLNSATDRLRAYWQRVLFVVGIGAFTAIVGPAMYWNWMNVAADYTIAHITDTMLASLVVGLVLSAVIKPKAA